MFKLGCTISARRPRSRRRGNVRGAHRPKQRLLHKLRLASPSPRHAMALSSSSHLLPFSRPPATFPRARHAGGGRGRAGATGRFMACSSPPPPDVVVTRERGKNAKLIAALVWFPNRHSCIVHLYLTHSFFLGGGEGKRRGLGD